MGFDHGVKICMRFPVKGMNSHSSLRLSLLGERVMGILEL